MALALDSQKIGLESVNGCVCDMGVGSFSLLGCCHFCATSLPCLLVRIPWRSIVFISRAQRLRSLSLFVWRGICEFGITGRGCLRPRSDINGLGNAGANPAIREKSTGESRP